LTLQGRKVIININGDTVARYSYDAWGKCTILQNSSEHGAIASINPFRYRGYYYDRETELYYLQSRYYDPEVGRFVNVDEVETVATVSDVITINQFSYCECDPINNVDSNGAISWKKILSIFDKIGSFAKKILDYLIEGAEFILGIKTYITRNDISKIAKNVKRSPHRVRQNFDWLHSRVKNLKTKTGRILKALSILLFFASIASVIGKVKSIVSTIIKTVAKIIADGLSTLLSWLVSKGIKLLSKFIPALGGVLGFLVGELIGRVIDAFFDKYSARIVGKYTKKVNVYKFSVGDYFTTFFKCLA